MNDLKKIWLLATSIKAKHTYEYIYIVLNKKKLLECYNFKLNLFKSSLRLIKMAISPFGFLIRKPKYLKLIIFGFSAETWYLLMVIKREDALCRKELHMSQDMIKIEP